MILSRREFLRLSGLAGLAFGAAYLPPLRPAPLPVLPPDEAPLQAEFLGRAIYSLNLYDRPSFNGRQFGLIPADSVFNIYATLLSDDKHYNRTWYQVQRGYVHSAAVQPVRWQLQAPVLDVPSDGFLGEITVPYTLAKTGPKATHTTVYRFFYATTHWITAVESDDQGQAWYKALDDRFQKYNWIRADHVRRVMPSEISPLSPGVPNKRIEVDLEGQVFRCLEGSLEVFKTLCATGPYLRTENGKRIFGTPAGDWSILRKRPTRHMAADDLAAADGFDLPGVPWVSYFHWWGVSIHGTYWHNDYGRPRSHGCVNLPPDAAKWVFRWSLPLAGLAEKETKGDGTAVVVY